LIALQISRQTDTEAGRRRKTQASGGKTKAKAQARGGLARLRDEYERHRSDAFTNLEQAEAIYRHHNHHHGIGSVYENRGLLYFDSGDLENAEGEANKAYALGKQENDAILMARARILQCEIANARLEDDEGME